MSVGVALRVAKVVAILIAGLGAPAQADEIRLITSGTITATSCCGGEFAFSGDDFVVHGGLSGGVDISSTMGDRPAGIAFSSHNFWSGFDIRRPFPDSTATVGGTTYDGIFLDGYLSLITGLIVIPTTGASTLMVQAPFSTHPFIPGGGPLLGAGSRLLIYDRSPGSLGPSDALFDLLLSGTGTATIAFTRFPGLENYHARSVVWQFDSAASNPVPEPATLFLVGSGLAGVFAARRKRRHQR
jgi:hypothetical protein